MSAQHAKPPAIGIDLGTCYTSVAVLRNNQVELIADEHGNRRVPCYVTFTPTGRLFGDEAKEHLAMNPNNTVSDIKRLIGNHINDVAVQRGMKFWPFKLNVENRHLKIEVEYENEVKSLYPEEIVAMFMSKAKEIAENYLEQTVTNAVISVPSCFSYAQRMATLDAAKIAGLNVLRLINEPTAAAFAYDVNRETDGSDRNVVIFDLGGSVTNVSVITFEEKILDVRATVGDVNLGGDDFDHNLVDYCIQDFYQRYRVDLTNNRRAIRLLLKACERVKRDLSVNEKSSLQIDALYENIDYTVTMTRLFFEELNANLFYRLNQLLEKVVFYSKLDKSSIHEVILVGGSTRIPRIQKKLKEYFDSSILNQTINPDEAVCYGAAVLASMLNGDKADIVKDLLILDVYPFTLGIETIDGLMSPIIPHNTTIPVVKTHLYAAHLNVTSEYKKLKPHLCANGRNGVLIEVYEGENRVAKENNHLGHIELEVDFELTAEIEVKFDIDANGNLVVSATDRLTDKTNEVLIKKGHFSRHEMNKLVSDAEKYKIDDINEHSRIAYRNSFETFCFNLKEAVNEHKWSDAISSDNRQTIVKTCDRAVKWLEENEYVNKSTMENEFRKVASVSRLAISPNTLSLYKSAYGLTGDMSFLMNNNNHHSASQQHHRKSEQQPEQAEH